MFNPEGRIFQVEYAMAAMKVIEVLVGIFNVLLVGMVRSWHGF